MDTPSTERHDFILSCSPAERTMLAGWFAGSDPDGFEEAKTLVLELRADVDARLAATA
jgi:hypothetical protein